MSAPAEPRTPSLGLRTRSRAPARPLRHDAMDLPRQAPVRHEVARGTTAGCRRGPRGAGAEGVRCLVRFLSPCAPLLRVLRRVDAPPPPTLGHHRGHTIVGLCPAPLPCTTTVSVGAGVTAGRAEKAAEAGAGRRPRQRRAPGGGRGGCGGGVRGGPSRGRREEKAAARVGAGRVLERRPRPAAGRGGGGGGRRAQRRSPWWCREEKPGAGQEESAAVAALGALRSPRPWLR